RNSSTRVYFSSTMTRANGAETTPSSRPCHSSRRRGRSSPDSMSVKLKVEDTPSQQAVAKAMESIDVTDTNGRVITLKKPGVLAQFRLIEMLGSASAKNEVYVSMVLPIIYVSAIQGDPVAQPATKLQL